MSHNHSIQPFGADPPQSQQPGSSEASLTSRHERAFPHTAAMHRYTSWAAGRVAIGARGSAGSSREWDSRNRFGLGLGRSAAWHVLARSVSTLAGKADTASGRVAGQSECLSRKRCGSVMTAQAFSGQCRASQHPLPAPAVCRVPVTAARLLDGARSVLGYQTR
jgi:hypothetical protein